MKKGSTMLRRLFVCAFAPLAAGLMWGAAPVRAAGLAAPPVASHHGAPSAWQGKHRRHPGAFIASPWAGGATVNQFTVIHQAAPRRDAPPQSGIGGVISLEDLPVVAGIRRPPPGPPTVYWLQGRSERQTWFGRQPGPRIITLADVEPPPARGRVAPPSPNAPRVIVIRAR